jgi:hypothetical protein
MQFNWILKQRTAYEKSFETLFKDESTGCKKWVIVLRTENFFEAKAKPRTEFYLPNGKGPFASETELRINFKNYEKNRAN